MAFSYCFTFSAIEMAVRCEDNSAQDIDAISCYIQMGLTRAQQHYNKVDARTAHMRIFNTLVDAMCDPCLTYAWRKRCYRYIKRLLPLLHEMYDTHQYAEKVREVNTLHRYFLGVEQPPSHSVLKARYKTSTPKKKIPSNSASRPQTK